MSQEQRVNKLRELLSALPGLHTWQQLWTEVDTWPTSDQDLSIEWDYLTHHIEEWPDHCRLLPTDKKEAWRKGEHAPMFPLVRGAEITQEYRLTGWEIMASPYAHQLTHLQLKRQTPAGSEVQQQLGRGDLQLKSLFWSDSQPNEEQLAALLQAPALQSLLHLDLQHNSLRQEECRALAAHAPPTLRHLNLNYNQLHAASAFMLLGSTRLAGLTRLSLRWNQLTNKRFCPITPTVESIQHLDLAYNQVGGRALQTLLQTQCFHHLKTLNLSGNAFDSKGISAFAAQLPQSLRALHMRCTDLNDESARLLANTLRWDTLETLDLSYNSIHPTTLEYLRTHPSLAHTNLLCAPHQTIIQEGASTTSSAPLTILAGAETDVGSVRSHNEDACGISHERKLFIVADGMGGQSSGGIASQTIVRALTAQRKAGPENEPTELLHEPTEILPHEASPISLELCAYLTRTSQPFQQTECFLYDQIERANALLHDSSPAITSRSMNLRGMGSAFACLAFLPQHDYALLSHAGSDRIYRWRHQKLTQLTNDHSLLNEYIKHKQMTPEEIQNFPYKNVITKALGIAEELHPDYAIVPIHPKDLFLICSDGIHSVLENMQIAAFLQRHEASLDTPSTLTLTGVCQSLIQEAILHNSQDNLTAMLVWAGHQHQDAI